MSKHISNGLLWYIIEEGGSMELKKLLFGQKYNLTEQEKEKMVEGEEEPLLPRKLNKNDIQHDLSDDEADLEEDDRLWDEDVETDLEESEE